MTLTDAAKIAAKCGELQKENTEIKSENAKLREERDRAEMACIEVRLSGGRAIESALAVASAVAQRANT